MWKITLHQTFITMRSIKIFHKWPQANKHTINQLKNEAHKVSGAFSMLVCKKGPPIPKHNNHYVVSLCAETCPHFSATIIPQNLSPKQIAPSDIIKLNSDAKDINKE